MKPRYDEGVLESSRGRIVQDPFLRHNVSVGVVRVRVRVRVLSALALTMDDHRYNRLMSRAEGQVRVWDPRRPKDSGRGLQREVCGPARGCSAGEEDAEVKPPPYQYYRKQRRASAVAVRPSRWITRCDLDLWLVDRQKPAVRTRTRTRTSTRNASAALAHPFPLLQR